MFAGTGTPTRACSHYPISRCCKVLSITIQGKELRSDHVGIIIFECEIN